MEKPRSLTVLVALLLLAAAPVYGAPVRLAAQAKEYMKQHGLGEPRTVKVSLPGREVDRLFVPVLPTTVADFNQRFSTPNGAIVWRAAQDRVHVAIQMKPGDANTHNARGAQAMVPAPEAGGQYLTMALDPDHITHLESFWNEHTVNGNLWNGNAKWQQSHPGEQIHGGCMWWLVHAELAPKLSLAHVMGVKRSKGPESLFPKLVHAGNDRVGPIGIGVKTIEEFNAMTDAQLMGPPPAAGALENMKVLP